VNGYLVDTNILSELTKPTPAPQVEAFLRQSKDRVFVSVFSIGEIRKGIASLQVSNRRAALEDWLDNEIMPWLGDRVLPVTLAIAERWGDLSAQLKAKGRHRPVVDAVIAATAFTHDLVLVTRNVRDYEDLGITILNPWESV
jgi:toxin FitB